MIEQIRNIDSSDDKVRKFGIMLGVAFCLLGAVLWWKSSVRLFFWFLVPAAFFVIAGFSCQRVLRPVYKVWMTGAITVGWVMSHVVLFFLFYVVFVPIGLLLKVFGKDVLEKKWSSNQDTYWHRRESEEYDRSRYEKQY